VGDSGVEAVFFFAARFRVAFFLVVFFI